MFRKIHALLPMFSLAIAILIAGTLTTPAQTAATCSLTVQITGIHNTGGHILLALPHPPGFEERPQHGCAETHR